MTRTLLELEEALRRSSVIVKNDLAVDSLAIAGPAPLDEASPKQFSFMGPKVRRPLEALRRSRAAILIVDERMRIPPEELRASSVSLFAFSAKPRLDFVRLINQFFPSPEPSRSIHPSAVVSSTARIGANVSIGPLATVGDDAEIGDGCVLHAGVHIYPRVRLGMRVVVHAGTVIGADGFGYERDESGELIKFPQTGSVFIEDEVEIGANVCIDRGTFRDTVVRRNTKVDNLSLLGHNVEVGDNCIITGLVAIGGSAKIGARSWLAPNTSIMNGIKIGSDATIGLGTVVTRSVKENMVVMGAHPVHAFEKSSKVEREES